MSHAEVRIYAAYTQRPHHCCSCHCPLQGCWWDFFSEYYDHMVIEDVHYVVSPRPWIVIYGFTQWFYKVSHSYMTLVVKRDPPNPAHSEILEEEHAKVEHVVMCFWHVIVFWILEEMPWLGESLRKSLLKWALYGPS